MNLRNFLFASYFISFKLNILNTSLGAETIISLYIKKILFKNIQKFKVLSILLDLQFFPEKFKINT